MYSEPAILDLVGLIYDAAGDARLWSAFLEKLMGVMECAASTLFVQDLSNHEEKIVAALGFEPAFQHSYEEYYATKNIYLIQGDPLLSRGNVCLTQKLCPDAVALRSEFYNDWIAPQKQHDGLMGVIFRERTLTGMLGVVRRRGANPFTEEDLSLTKSLMPHLQRAVQLHQRITDLEVRQKAAADALNRWPMGVILLDANGSVLLMNRSAELIINEKDGLSMDAGGLRAARTNETITLRALIRGAIQTTSGNCLHSGGALALPRPSFKRDLNVLVAPVCANDTLFPETGAACAVFVSDPESGDETDEEALQRFYGLSRAEARVAALLMQGRSVEQVAEELYVSLSTAKTHLRRIFDKTSTRRRGELVRLLLRSPAHLRLKTANRAVDHPRPRPKKAS